MHTQTNSEAHVEFDPMSFGVRIMLRRKADGGAVYVNFPEPVLRFVRFEERGQATGDEVPWLRLDEDDARAVYEELADYFGHAGHDTRSLRNDYDAERKRVDKLIDAAIRRD